MNVEHAKGVLAKQAVRLKPNSLGHRIRFVRSFFHYAYEEMYLLQKSIVFDILMHANSLIRVTHWISSKECPVMRTHRPLKSTHNSEANIGENSIDDSFSLYWRRISL
jgi:hypothetical protein